MNYAYFTGTQKVLKYSSLLCLTLQNAALNLTMRMARTQPELFISSTAVVMAEIMKLFACLFMVGTADERSFRGLFKAVRKYVIDQPFDTFKVRTLSYP